MVDSDNAKSKREFKKLSKSMGDKLDKEKGRSVTFATTKFFGLWS
jgi:GATA-binding protein